jgi:DNA-directed RNA polymerase subunit RPC12/RpoP
MPAVRTLLRRCPSCGHRFSIRLVSQREVSDEGATNPNDYAVDWEWWNENDFQLHADHVIDVNATLPVAEAKVVEYNYVCRNCDHKWSEKTIKIIKRLRGLDYKGD